MLTYHSCSKCSAFCSRAMRLPEAQPVHLCKAAVDSMAAEGRCREELWRIAGPAGR